VLSGHQHLARLGDLHDDLLGDRSRFLRRRPPAERELLGFRYGTRLLAELEELSLERDLETLQGADIGLLLTDDDSGPIRELVSRFALHTTVDLERPDELWWEITSLEMAMNPSPEIDQLSEAVAATG